MFEVTRRVTRAAESQISAFQNLCVSPVFGSGRRPHGKGSLGWATARLNPLRMASARQEPELHTRLALFGGAGGEAFEPMIGVGHGFLCGCDVGEGVGLGE